MASFVEEADREQFFESARKQAQREFEADGKNAQALVRWGGALLELAHYKQGEESVTLIEQAISKLQKAIELDPDRTESEWILGNAYTSLGFLCPDKRSAQEKFTKAADCFKRCNQKDPSNETYRKAIEMCDKAPDYYDEIQTQLKESSSAEDVRRKDRSSSGDIWWDVAGWVCLAGLLFSVAFVARSQTK